MRRSIGRSLKVGGASGRDLQVSQIDREDRPEDHFDQSGRLLLEEESTCMELESAVRSNYSPGRIVERIREALEREGKRTTDLTIEELAALDEFHLRRREATLEIVKLLGGRPGMLVLDVGSGLGGPARVLASESSCRVTGIDLSDEFCEAGNELSRWVGMEGAVSLEPGNALAMPYEAASFDAAWTIHAAMNIRDKARLYREVRRVLRPEGRFVIYDILAGPAGPPNFPVPWASDEGTSFLVGVDELRLLLEEADFEILDWVDRTEECRIWLEADRERLRSKGPAALGLHVTLGADFKEKLANVYRNLVENRVQVGIAVCQSRS